MILILVSFFSVMVCSWYSSSDTGGTVVASMGAGLSRGIGDGYNLKDGDVERSQVPLTEGRKARRLQKRRHTVSIGGAVAGSGLPPLQPVGDDGEGSDDLILTPSPSPHKHRTYRPFTADNSSTGGSSANRDDEIPNAISVASRRRAERAQERQRKIEEYELERQRQRGIGTGDASPLRQRRSVEMLAQRQQSLDYISGSDAEMQSVLDSSADGHSEGVALSSITGQTETATERALHDDETSSTQAEMFSPPKHRRGKSYKSNSQPFELSQVTCAQ